MYKFKLYRKMKKLSNLLLLIFGLSTFSAIAQMADSVVVIYDNQKTIIPVPAFGSQTTIKLADSIQTIEIGVSRRKPNDIPMSQQNVSFDLKGDKPLKKVKWYSQVEAGYTIKFIAGSSSESIIVNGTEPATLYYNTDNQQGYKIGISVFEKERYISNNFSYVSGFKLGFAQSYRKGKSQDIVQDSVLHLYVGYEPLTTSSIQFLFPFGFRQNIGSGISVSRIIFGSNIGSSIDLMKTKGINGYINFGGSPLIIQPFLGFEKGKLGILITADFPFRSTYNVSTRETVLKIDDGIGFSLTYRLF
jgi:hypothetical protein